MEKTTANVAGVVLDIYRLDTLVLGSGAAGLNAADTLTSLGVRDVAVLTEGLDKGTSRNTGSDKQTYYKLNLAGGHADSVRAMAGSLFDGGAMHGDIALVQAALSPVCFSRLVDIGVPFPHNEYGEYVGYRTDHDASTRATSAGPLTSQVMTRCLERQVRAKGVPILENMQAVAVITSDKGSGDVGRRIAGLLALDIAAKSSPRFVLFQCARLVYATGGPAGLYADSVYPVSQSGATGIALEAGAPGQNLTEWQYGIASTRFRWNLSGTYQQVLPRYVSASPDGSDEREFLYEYFDSEKEALSAVFHKGYQWPFDPRKLGPGGSSIVDIAVYKEIRERGRKVYLDYRSNPHGALSPLTADRIGTESHAYLERSGALGGTPIERLRIMNPDAVRLYEEHGIDLSSGMLEIAVCAQHNNGGLTGDLWWESPLPGLYPVGEAGGSFGIYRPGGSALNETQAGSRRAASRIAREGPARLKDLGEFVEDSLPFVRHRLALAAAMLTAGTADRETGERLAPGPFRHRFQRRMSDVAGFLRDPGKMRTALANCLKELYDPSAGQYVTRPGQLTHALRNYDLLLAQAVYLTAMIDAADRGVGSRGSYLVLEASGDQACAGLRYRLADGDTGRRVQECTVSTTWEDPKPAGTKGDVYPRYKITSAWTQVRPIPPDNQWFENDWAMYRSSLSNSSKSNSSWSVSTKEDSSC